MLNIVVPIAGRGSRFADAGHRLPKPLIPLHGRPMIEIVVDNVRPNRPHRFIFLCLKTHLEAFPLADLLRCAAPDCVIVPVQGVTEGAAVTALMARAWMEPEEPLMIANGDQWVDADINDYLCRFDAAEAEGCIMTMRADHPKWSYVRFDDTGRICEVVEKKVVSNEATVGIYNWKRGADFIESAECAIEAEQRVNGEFYIAPTYNSLLERGAEVVFHNVGSEFDGMYGMGIPADLERFAAMPISLRAAGVVEGRAAVREMRTREPAAGAN